MHKTLTRNLEVGSVIDEVELVAGKSATEEPVG